MVQNLGPDPYFTLSLFAIWECRVKIIHAKQYSVSFKCCFILNRIYDFQIQKTLFFRMWGPVWLNSQNTPNPNLNVR